MCKLFSQYQSEIKKYCDESGLDFEKVLKMPQCWSNHDIWIQYHDPEKGKKGLIDETPAPIVLKISVNNDGLSFEQTEYTRKYLA